MLGGEARTFPMEDKEGRKGRRSRKLSTGSGDNESCYVAQVREDRAISGVPLQRLRGLCLLTPQGPDAGPLAC